MSIDIFDENEDNSLAELDLGELQKAMASIGHPSGKQERPKPTINRRRAPVVPTEQNIKAYKEEQKKKQPQFSPEFEAMQEMTRKSRELSLSVPVVGGNARRSRQRRTSDIEKEKLPQSLVSEIGDLPVEVENNPKSTPAYVGAAPVVVSFQSDDEPEEVSNAVELSKKEKMANRTLQERLLDENDEELFDANNKSSGSNSSTKTKRRRGRIIESEDVPVNVGRIENTRKDVYEREENNPFAGPLPNDINLYTIQDYVSKYRMIGLGIFLGCLLLAILLVAIFGIQLF